VQLSSKVRFCPPCPLQNGDEGQMPPIRYFCNFRDKAQMARGPIATRQTNPCAPLSDVPGSLHTHRQDARAQSNHQESLRFL